MAACTACGEEVAQGAAVCKHCKATLGTPKRPVGVTVLAVLLFVGAGLTLLGLLGRQIPILFGMIVPQAVFYAFVIAMSGVSIYCGIGFLKLLTLARTIYFVSAGIGIAQSLVSFLVIVSSYRIPDEVMATLIVGLILGVGIQGFIVYYLIRRKDFFVN